MMDPAKRCQRRIGGVSALLLCCLSFLSCDRREPATAAKRDLAKEDLAVYRKTNDQPGHELVKSEQFLVPTGSVIVIEGLEFEPGSAALTRMHERILQQVFNSLEELTEDIVGDTNRARAAELKKMEFEIRGYPDPAGDSATNAALAEQRAKAVFRRLTNEGAPAWRFTVIAVDAKTLALSAAHRQKSGRVEFVRTR